MKNLLIASSIVFALLASTLIALAVYKQQYQALVMLPVLMIFFSIILLLSKHRRSKS